MSPFYFDLEAVARDEAADLVREPKARGNLVDPEKIAADKEKKAAALKSRLALDPFGCRIVAAGWACGDDPVRVHLCYDEDDERWAVSTLIEFMASSDEIVTFNGRAYDVPVVMARAWLLGVTVPRALRLAVEKRYDSRIIDLYQVVTFGQGRSEDTPISRGLVSMSKVFGLGIPDDDEDGSQIAQMVAEGRWDDVREHCARDVERTRALALRLGVSLTAGQTEMAGVR